MFSFNSNVILITLRHMEKKTIEYLLFYQLTEKKEFFF